MRLLALAAWLGGSAFFALAVAPAAFATLPSRELAGALVGRILPVLFWAGAIVGLATATVEARDRNRRYRVPRIAASAVMAIACLVAQLSIAPRIAALRAEMPGPLATLPIGDPQRIMFGRLHMLSVAWLGLAILACVVSLALAFIILRPRPGHEHG